MESQASRQLGKLGVNESIGRLSPLHLRGYQRSQLNDDEARRAPLPLRGQGCRPGHAGGTPHGLLRFLRVFWGERCELRRARTCPVASPA